nr:YceK/YidQ family lipoprotein [Escherichia coli]
MATNIIPVCNGMCVTPPGVMSQILDLPFSLVFDTLLLPIDTHHGPYE